MQEKNADCRKMQKNLHMWKKSSTFAADLCEGAVVGLEP